MSSAQRPDRILKLLVSAMTFLLVFAWLPLLRAILDGSTYQWGESHFGFMFRAAGFEATSWLLVLKTVLLVSLLWLALRNRSRGFAAFLVLWSGVLAADAVHGAVTDPGGFEFHGDTLGIHLNLGLGVVGFFVGLLLLSLYWSARHARREPIRVPWTARNRTLLAAVLVLLPLQFLLLRFGEPHGTTDAVGVLITIAQCPLFTMAIYPWGTGEATA